MNEREFDGDCSDVCTLNSVAECDEFRVAFTDEDDLRNEMVRCAENIKSEKVESESDEDFYGFDINNGNESDNSQIEIMKEEYHFGNEIESKYSEHFTLKQFENDSGEHANVDVAMPVVNSTDVSVNSKLESMKAESHIKQEKSSQGLDEFGDGLNYVFEIAGVRTILNMEDCEHQNITIEPAKVGMKLRNRGSNNKTRAAIINTHPSRVHAREGRDGPSPTALQSTACKRLQSGAQLHTCVAGNQSFKTKSSLVRHECIPSGGRRYKCNKCNKSFGQSNTLTIHKRTLRPYKCTVCNKAFAHTSNLIRHKRLHSGEKPYKCTVCNKAFAQSGNLTTHKRLHSGDKPFKCTVCNKAFAQPSTLITHKRIHSGDKPYKCTACNKTFAQSTTLTIHKRTHSGDRPYKCTLCNKAFAQSTALTIHKRTHSGDKPYKCTVCNKPFAQLNNLMRHKRTHDGDRP